MRKKSLPPGSWRGRGRAKSKGKEAQAERKISKRADSTPDAKDAPRAHTPNQATSTPLSGPFHPLVGRVVMDNLMSLCSGEVLPRSKRRKSP